MTKDWEEIRGLVHKHYVVEGRKLSDVQEILRAGPHEFKARQVQIFGFMSFCHMYGQFMPIIVQKKAKSSALQCTVFPVEVGRMGL